MLLLQNSCGVQVCQSFGIFYFHKFYFSSVPMIEYQTFDFGFVNFFVFFRKFIVLLCKLLMVFVSRFRFFYFFDSLFGCAFGIYQRQGFVVFSLDYGFVYLLIDYFLPHKPSLGTLFAIVYQGFQSVGIDFGDGIVHSDVFGCRYLASILPFLQFRQAFVFLFLVILCCNLGFALRFRVEVYITHHKDVQNLVVVFIRPCSLFRTQQCIVVFRYLGDFERCFFRRQSERTVCIAQIESVRLYINLHTCQRLIHRLAFGVRLHRCLFHDARSLGVLHALSKRYARCKYQNAQCKNCNLLHIVPFSRFVILFLCRRIRILCKGTFFPASDNFFRRLFVFFPAPKIRSRGLAKC